MFGIYRFILALFVVFYHILNFPLVGPYAVYSFFILSGFLMTTIMHKTYDYSLKGRLYYGINRFLRLFPAYWLLLAISALIFYFIGYDFTTKFNAFLVPITNYTELLANITLLYPEVKPVNYPVRLAPATWALTIELFFYFLIALGLSKTKKITLIWLFLSIAYIAFRLIVYKEYVTGYGSFLTASFPFAIGSSLYFYKDTIYSLIQKIPSYFNVILSLFLFNILFTSILSVIYPEILWKLNFFGTYINLFLTALLTIVLLKHGHTYCDRTTDNFYGDLSYPVYVFHWSGACLASWLLYQKPVTGLNITALNVVALGIVITIIVSVLVNKLINRPLTILRNSFKKIQ